MSKATVRKSNRSQSTKPTAAQKESAKNAAALRDARAKHADWKVQRADKLHTMEERATAKAAKAAERLAKIMERRANFEAKAAERLLKIEARHDPVAKKKATLAKYRRLMAKLENELANEK